MIETWSRLTASAEGPRSLVAYGAVAALALLGFIVLTMTSPPYLLYDEGYYQTGALLLVDGHGIYELLLAQFAIPTGPLYAVLHSALAPVTGMELPYIRFVNPVLLLLDLGLLAYIFRQWKLDRPALRAAALMAVPMIWVTAGMALTEIPAFTFATLAVALVAGIMSVEGAARGRIWMAFVLSGLCLGIAALGRQVILPAAVGYVLIALFEPRLRWPAVVAALLVLAVVLPVFFVWGGIVPPNDSGSAHNGGLSVAHGLFALCYLAITLVILAPGYFLVRWRVTLLAAILGGLIGMAVGDVGFQIAGALTSRIPTALQPWVQRCATGALFAAGGALATASMVNIWTFRENRVFVLSTCLMGGLALTAAALTMQFSSRYLMTAFPFVLISVQPFFRPNAFSAVRVLAGAGLGATLLMGYYDGADFWVDCTIDGYRAYCDH